MMLNRKRKQIIDASGSWFLVRVTVVLFALLMISGAVTAQLQKGPSAFITSGTSEIVNPKDHTAYYLPSYDGYRWYSDYFCMNFSHYRCGRSYYPGYWYPWTFKWGRYDIPNYRWWTFGEGFYDERSGGIWTADAPVLATARKTGVAQLPLQLEPVTRAIKPPPRVARRSGFGSTGMSMGRGSSTGSSGGGSSFGSSSGGSGGGKKSGKK